jgi:predicted Zn-dependent protease
MMKNYKAHHQLFSQKLDLLKSIQKVDNAYETLEKWLAKYPSHSEILKMEFIKLLIEVDKKEEALKNTHELLNTLHSSLTRHFCSHCGLIPMIFSGDASMS